ncbi:hypothetical protein Pmar_PMAR006719 [Perkinsus marinus ATCC 50983]|uniref:Mitochondrial carrier protein n=1 Tax=Perkinsus marinus (strain ATCC 50983 / TXsc) TaxID=423536 RepID=C5K6A7_PERM5|nr:hypothetical protein Pmar_PMAR006719 [Perkinsus marinus ATCC 50983]EER19827.1 hypothetical protein Pmar_PMAR006719 [Perkinsus marinus ATCC 50983]|eukprot:XP_002788031.1 hypothetical protein Pmar_PMAR006719 [Perkinsus marinus ATCC 50983]
MPSTIAPPTPSPSPPLVVIDKGCTTIIHNEGGMYALFKGCIPALFRASIYGGARLGLYQRKDNAMMIIMNVIMTNVSSSSHEHKKEYSTLYTNLWRGTSMSVIRAALLTASQIISYTTLKTYITNKRDSIHMPYINDPTVIQGIDHHDDDK